MGKTSDSLGAKRKTDKKPNERKLKAIEDRKKGLVVDLPEEIDEKGVIMINLLNDPIYILFIINYLSLFVSRNLGTIVTWPKSGNLMTEQLARWKARSEVILYSLCSS